MTIVQPVYSEEEKKLIAALRKLAKESNDEDIIAAERAFDDEMAMMWLRCRKYNVKSAYERAVRLVYARKKKYPEMFDRFTPETLRTPLDEARARVLKSRDNQGRHVLVYRASWWNPNIVNLDDLIGMTFLVGFEMIQHVETQFNGVTIIIDGAGYSLDQLKQITPFRVQKYVYLITAASPLKIKAIHLMNAPWVANTAINLVKMFVPQKLRERIYAHGTSTKSLQKFFRPEILPEWLGGELSDEMAFDHQLVENLYSKEKNDYYKKLLTF